MVDGRRRAFWDEPSAVFDYYVVDHGLADRRVGEAQRRRPAVRLTWQHRGSMGLALLLVFLLLPGLAGALMSKPFEPTARLAPLRWLVTAGASAVGAALLVSLAQDWWVVDDYEREEVLLTEGTSGFPIVVVSAGVVACVLVVPAA